MTRELRGAGEDRAGGAGNITIQNLDTEVSHGPGLEDAGEGGPGESKVREHLREIKSVTASPVAGPWVSCQIRSSLRDQETSLHRGKRI